MLTDRCDNRSGVLRYNEDVLLEWCLCIFASTAITWAGVLLLPVLTVLFRIGDNDPKLSFFVSLSSRWLSVGEPKCRVRVFTSNFSSGVPIGNTSFSNCRWCSSSK